jgi:membrane associated rhomboid family serine protease
MTLRSATKTLLVLALGLPVVQSVLFWIVGMLASMGDEPGANIIRHVGTGCQVVWSIALVGLVISLAMLVLNERPTDGE